MTRHSILIEGDFSLEAGGVLHDIEVVYHTSDRPYGNKEKVVWITHALTANSDPEDWWDKFVGPGKLIDTQKYYVVCANILGSPYGTTSPISFDKTAGRQYLLDFPRITVRDMVRVMIELRRRMGIERIDFMIGSSIGGFQSLEWLVMEPDIISKAVIMATEARVSPYLSAFEESQRMSLEADPTFLESKDVNGGRKALEAARSIALISYRSYEGYCSTQTEEDENTLFARRAASYQRHQGRKLSDRFDAYSYYTLANALDSHNLGRGRGGLGKALGSIRAGCTVIAIDSDCLFPPHVMQNMAASIPGAEYKVISSRFGHDGFLLEIEQLSQIVGPILATI